MNFIRKFISSLDFYFVFFLYSVSLTLLKFPFDRFTNLLIKKSSYSSITKPTEDTLLVIATRLEMFIKWFSVWE